MLMFQENLIGKLPNNDSLTTIIIFDNAPVHRQAENVQQVPNISVRSLPPYLTFFNVVENCFSQWKATIKRDLADIRENITCIPHQRRMASLEQIAEQAIIVLG